MILCVLFSLTLLVSSTGLASIKFSRACDGVRNVTIGAVGDFLMHDPLQKKAQVDGTFANIWNVFLPYIQSVDVMYGNLETPTARGLGRDGRIYQDPGLVYERNVHTSFPLFNVHPQLVLDLKQSGFDVVSTANNHALDRGPRGVDMTIDELEKVGLQFTGTRRQGVQTEWFTRIDRSGISTAWLACTFVLNTPDSESQVLHCDRDRREVLRMIQDLSARTDAVIVTPHWGTEYSNKPESYQVSAAKAFLEAGALAVIGAHPHALQPLELYRTHDGRETLIAYSLANFVSFQPRLTSKTTVMLFVGLGQDDRGATFINGVRFIPAFMRNRTGNFRDVEILPIREGHPHGQEGLGHILSLFPEANQLKFGDRVVTNPECVSR